MGDWIEAATHGQAGTVHVYVDSDGRPERVSLSCESDRRANGEAIEAGIKALGWRLLGTRELIDRWAVERGEGGEAVWIVRQSDLERGG